MRRYSCPVCQNELHFANSRCVQCSTEVGYWHVGDVMFAKDAAAHADNPLTPCANRRQIGCNWLCDGTEQTAGYCRSCSHSVMIPDLSLPDNIERWSKLERAKRLLFCSVGKFGLSAQTSGPDGKGEALRFEFKADVVGGGAGKGRVLTGHDNGLITINIAEADDDIRERNRTRMGEQYRTLVGHFRHEVGHFYWDALVRDGGKLDAFRNLFGDERDDYSAALERHYQNGPQPGWMYKFVSGYATSHPWEDFAETFAHYFHMVDALETAASYAILPLDMNGRGTATGMDQSAYNQTDIKALISAWVPLTVAMNAMNRSIGNHDFYPFVLSDTIQAKLKFIHDLIHFRSGSADGNDIH